jgi:hypothetical protein
MFPWRENQHHNQYFCEEWHISISEGVPSTRRRPKVHANLAASVVAGPLVRTTFLKVLEMGIEFAVNEYAH